jgi:small subunit ribosomal protein S20
MIALLYGVCYIPPVKEDEVRGVVTVPALSKRDKQSHRKSERNKAVRTRLKNISKNFYKAVDAGEAERATRIRDEAQRAYDKAARKGVIHPNKAARKTSRLDKALVGASSPDMY